MYSGKGYEEIKANSSMSFFLFFPAIYSRLSGQIKTKMERTEISGYILESRTPLPSRDLTDGSVRRFCKNPFHLLLRWAER
jgi:hypothetical protein